MGLLGLTRRWIEVDEGAAAVEITVRRTGVDYDETGISHGDTIRMLPGIYAGSGAVHESKRHATR